MTQRHLKLLPNTLHLTVNHHGRVTLWDGRNAAMTAVKQGEIYIPRTVDPDLRLDIVAAAEMATDNDEGFTP